VKRSIDTDSWPWLFELRYVAEQPRALGVLVDVALDEEHAALGVEPGGEQRRRRVDRVLEKRRRVVRNADRVQVDDAVERLAALLVGDVVPDGAEVVAEVLSPRRLDAREHARHGE
jgi:hypothetical protein